jgi:hypothetical protein
MGILATTKKLLGIADEDTNFDIDICVNINSAIANLQQLGIGPTPTISITDDSTDWDDLLGTRTDLEGAKMYVYLKTRLVFDPPISSFVLDAVERQISQLEWRLTVQVETEIDNGS